MKVIATNKRALFDYDILKTVEAGIILTGAELKALLLHQVSLKESYVKFFGSEVYLWNAHISKYKYAKLKDYDEYRKRKLLLHKRQILNLLTESKKLGVTIIPLKVYLSDRNKVKLEIALARGKKKYDKREKVKKREMKREKERYLKTGRS